MEEILLIGGGGHCKSVIDIIEQENRFKIAGIIDKKELIGDRVLGYPIIGCDSDLEELLKIYKYAFVTVGQIESNTIRVKLFNRLKSLGYKLPIIVSPLAYISKYAFIDEGTVVHHFAVVNADVKIGKNCIINTKALIEHDVTVEDNCHISTGAVLNGGVIVKRDSFIGSNATIREYIKVEGFIKARSLVK